jgi:hypothetical protein
MKSLLLLSIAIILTSSCEKRRTTISNSDPSIEATNKQIGYLSNLTSKSISENDVRAYLDSLELCDKNLGETPDSLAKILSLLYEYNTEEVMIIPNSLLIHKVDNMTTRHKLAEYRVSISFRPSNSKRTIHLSDVHRPFIQVFPTQSRDRVCSGNIFQELIMKVLNLSLHHQ